MTQEDISQTTKPECSVMHNTTKWPYIRKCRTEAVATIQDDIIVRELDVSLICQTDLEDLQMAYPNVKVEYLEIPVD